MRIYTLYICLFMALFKADLCLSEPINCSKMAFEHGFSGHQKLENEEKAINLVLRRLLDAKQSIYIQAYGFSNPDIARLLVVALHKGVTVNIIVDKSSRNSKAVRFLKDNGITVFVDKSHPIAHNKVMIIDSWLLTGSFNFTKQALKNAENIIALDCPEAVERYYQEYLYHLKHSELLN